MQPAPGPPRPRRQLPRCPPCCPASSHGPLTAAPSPRRETSALGGHRVPRVPGGALSPFSRAAFMWPGRGGSCQAGEWRGKIRGLLGPRAGCGAPQEPLRTHAGCCAPQGPPGPWEGCGAPQKPLRPQAGCCAPEEPPGPWAGCGALQKTLRTQGDYGAPQEPLRTHTGCCAPRGPPGPRAGCGARQAALTPCQLLNRSPGTEAGKGTHPAVASDISSDPQPSEASRCQTTRSAAISSSSSQRMDHYGVKEPGEVRV